MVVKVFSLSYRCVFGFTRLFQTFLNTNNVRLLSITLKKVDPTAITVSVEEIKANKNSTTRVLKKLLGINDFKAYTIATAHKKISETTSAILKYNFKKLKEEGITNDTILKYPILLAEESIDVKLEQLNKLPYNKDEVAPLILLPLDKLKGFVQRELKYRNNEGRRVAALTNMLDVSKETACRYLYEKPFLQYMSLAKLKNTVDILTEYGVKKEDIGRDLWVLRYRTDLIKRKLDIAKKNDIETVKTWMVRCQPKIYQKYIQRRSDNKEILGDNNSVEEYLSKKLECSMDIAKYLIQKQPGLNNKSLKKLTEIIDFLFSKGFKTEHIHRVPRILIYKIETIKTRLEKLQEKGIQIDSFYMLTKSQKQFDLYLETIGKSNKKTKSE